MEMFHTQGKKTQGKHTNTTNFWHVRSHDYVITAVSKNIVCVAFLLLSPSAWLTTTTQYHLLKRTTISHLFSCVILQSNQRVIIAALHNLWSIQLLSAVLNWLRGTSFKPLFGRIFFYLSKWKYTKTFFWDCWEALKWFKSTSLKTLQTKSLSECTTDKSMPLQ